MSNAHGRCIFCEGYKLSKEHLLSDWLRELFPRSGDDTHTYGTLEYKPKPTMVHTVRQGHSGSRKVRTVCIRCNNEWMSQIDDAAKAVAIPLIKGEKCVVTEDIARILALWFSKTAIVGDSIKPTKSIILQSERSHLMNDKTPPKNWEVWIGTYEGTAWRDLGLYQNGGKLDFTPVVGTDDEAWRTYIQSTIIGMGNLFALVVASDTDRFAFEVGKLADTMKRIWPFAGEFEWPCKNRMTDEEATAAQHFVSLARANIHGTKFRA